MCELKYNRIKKKNTVVTIDWICNITIKKPSIRIIVIIINNYQRIKGNYGAKKEPKITLLLINLIIFLHFNFRRDNTLGLRSIN